MARGITEAQVHAAADALVVAGERPTVERIRAHLGSGSPNTVTRLLDSWWKGLGPRLAALGPRVALPEAPDAVQRLAGEWWAHAVAAARELAEAALAGERETLAQAQAAFVDAQAESAAGIAAATQAREATDQARALAEARLAEAQRRADQLEAQLGDITLQRDGLAQRVETLDRERARLTEQLQAERQAATQERDAQAAHLRAVEDRAHSEVDRVRQELLDLRKQLRAIASERGREQEAARKALQEAHAELIRAQRELAMQRGRAEVLERQLIAVQAKFVPAMARGKRRTAETPARPPNRPRHPSPRS